MLKAQLWELITGLFQFGANDSVMVPSSLLVRIWCCDVSVQKRFCCWWISWPAAYYCIIVCCWDTMMDLLACDIVHSTLLAWWIIWWYWNFCLNSRFDTEENEDKVSWQSTSNWVQGWMQIKHTLKLADAYSDFPASAIERQQNYHYW